MKQEAKEMRAKRIDEEKREVDKKGKHQGEFDDKAVTVREN